MNGSIRKRGKSSYELTIDLGRDAKGKRRRKVVTVKGTKAMAQEELRKFLTHLDNGSPIETSRETVGEFLTRWLRDHVPTQNAPSTADGYGFIVRCHLIPEMGDIRLRKLTSGHIQEYYSKALKVGRRDGKGGLSARTVQHHHRVLSKALSWGVKVKALATNAAKEADAPRPSRGDTVILPPDDIDRLLDAAQETHYYHLVFTALYTGMRRGELLGLRWRDVDLLMATISVTRSLQRLYGGDFSVREPKSARSRRLIPMPPSLAILLRRHKDSQERQRRLLGPVLREDDLVFAHPDGSPMDPSTVSHTFRKIVHSAGLNNVRFHDLRHAHASLMLRTGADPKVISERLGHSSIATTMDIYAHVLPGLQEEAVVRFETVLKPRIDTDAVGDQGNQQDTRA